MAGGGATVVLFAPTPPQTTLPVSPYKLLFSEITLTGSYSCSPLETRQALALLRGGRIDADPLITHRFGLDGVGEAIRLAKKGGQSLKIVITP
jgi:threonine dehydrogenase-like Zn-dependent dehydrogenase